jgi:hypothetical protein
MKQVTGNHMEAQGKIFSVKKICRFPCQEGVEGRRNMPPLI